MEGVIFKMYILATELNRKQVILAEKENGRTADPEPNTTQQLHWYRNDGEPN